MNNNVTIAPQVNNATSLFQVWRQSHIGSYKDFIEFITTPTGERSRFLMTVQATGTIHGSLMFNQVTTGQCLATPSH